MIIFRYKWLKKEWRFRGRDLKSPNLLLSRPPPRSAMDPDTTVKIADFGKRVMML
jgi:hypothetical protein